MLQCGHNIEEAMRRRKMQSNPPADTMSLWSEEECRSFENGLRTYGKDFHLIQQNKVGLFLKKKLLYSARFTQFSIYGRFGHAPLENSYSFIIYGKKLNAMMSSQIRLGLKKRSIRYIPAQRMHFFINDFMNIVLFSFMVENSKRLISDLFHFTSN